MGRIGYICSNRREGVWKVGIVVTCFVCYDKRYRLKNEYDDIEKDDVKS
jgi:hypothetical protein